MYGTYHKRNDTGIATIGWFLLFFIALLGLWWLFSGTVSWLSTGACALISLLIVAIKNSQESPRRYQ